MAASMYNIEEQLKQNEIEEVHLIATKSLSLNCNLKWSGKNIFVYAPIVRVSNKLIMDVSGRDGEGLERAKDGGHSGESGADGLGGQPGESGGNVHICCDQLEGGENLTIKSVGGKGGDGQDGGHGKDGRDGEDGIALLEENFNRCFPPARRADIGETRQKYIINAESNTITDEPVNGKGDVYCKFTQKHDGRKVTLGIHRNTTGAVFSFGIARHKQAHCLVEGAPGKVGGDGGDGGCGGPGGCGGEAGNINVTNIIDSRAQYQEHRIDIVRGKGQPGEPGKAGTVGQGGKGGLQGNDIGRMEPDQGEANCKTLMGCLGMRYHEKELKGQLPYCPSQLKYVEIYQNDLNDLKRNRNGSAGKAGKTPPNVTSTPSIRKKAIGVKKLMDEYGKE